MEKRFVVPGDFIGTEEEYLPGNGTFTEREKIYASLSGEIKEDGKRLTVSQKRPLKTFDVGTKIVGVVENIIEPIALVSIHTGYGEQLIDEDERFGETSDYAVLHASMIKKGYVKNVRDEYKIGDIIRAKIVDIRNGELRLATDNDDLGAIKAFCPKCRHAMKLDGRILECEGCGFRDNRKIANDYRKADADL